MSSTSSSPESECSAFDLLAERIATCLRQSDLKRDDGFDGASTGWTSWVDEASATQLRACLDQLLLRWKDNYSSIKQWLQASPSPMILEGSEQLRQAVQQHLEVNITSTSEHANENSKSDFLKRIGCRCILLPSGSTLPNNLQSPPGAMVYGKLLWGGVTRFRCIGRKGRHQRRAGERRAVVGDDDIPTEAWLQYGGPERNYQAVDMGACFVVEIILLPQGLEVEALPTSVGTMIATRLPDDWRLQDVFDFYRPDASEIEKLSSDERTTATYSLSVCDLESSFCKTVGGLRPQIDEIVRRVLDGRVVRPASEIDSDSSNSSSTSSRMDTIRREEMKGLLELGLQPVRGLLLYGPPGCGKTALAREISTILDARPPKIVAAPELLDRWVGGSERLVRELFVDAEAELAACNGDPTKSALHVVVIDEIDAVFRKRSSMESSGEVTRASTVNQILAKLDGINALGNVLFIGMTNRKELLDPALLRPGRLEVLVEIPLPDREGRREILRIHFDALRQRGRLSRPLCDAIDGGAAEESKYFLPWRRRFSSSSLYGSRRRIRDLAADRWTGGFSGADIAGLVRCAGSLALARSRRQGDGGFDNLLITLDDVAQALKEVQQ